MAAKTQARGEGPAPPHICPVSDAELPETEVQFWAIVSQCTDVCLLGREFDFFVIQLREVER